MNVFFLVLARDTEFVSEKIKELRDIKVPFIIICGEKTSLPNAVYKKPLGKYDAINYGSKFVNSDADIICLNDVDTKIHNFEKSLESFKNRDVDMVFCKVVIKDGPQPHFYRLLDRIREKLPITASGELILIKREAFKRVLPLPPCKAEDTYILYKMLELNRKVLFCKECWITTERTKTLYEETAYKKRTVGGIYHALGITNPPLLIRIFYLFLPLLTPLLGVFGRKGFSWIKGIMLGFADYLSGNRQGKF